MKIHIVQKGDTLWKLAKKYGVPFEELKKLNSQLSNPDMIMPGMKLKIPGLSSSKSNSAASNTKINMHSQKEGVKSGILKPIMNESAGPSVKEQPKPPVKEMQKPSVKEQPKPPVKEMQKPSVKEQPKPPVKEMQKPSVKEQPKPPVKEMQKPPVKEQPKPPVKEMQKPVPIVPQPVIPEIDINNYYMVNMANMTVQKPAQKPAGKPIVNEHVKPIMNEHAKPIMNEHAKPIMKEQVMPIIQQPQHKPQKPIAKAECVAITPVMPGPGFCQPIYPMHHHFCEPVYGQMIQPLCGEESSVYQPQSYMSAPQMEMPFVYSNIPSYQGYGSPVPEVSAHGLHHQIESSSHPGMIKGHHSHEEDCGCDESESMPLKQPYQQAFTPQLQQPYQSNPTLQYPYQPNQTHHTNEMMMPNQSNQPNEMMMPKQTYQPNEMMMPNQAYQPNEMMMPKQTYQPNEMMMPNQAYQPNEMMMPNQAYQPNEMMMPNQAYQPNEMMMPNQANQPNEMMMPHQTHHANEMMMPNQAYQSNMMPMSNQPNAMFMPNQAVNTNHMPTRVPQQSVPYFTQYAQPMMQKREEEQLFSSEQYRASASEAFNMPRYADESSEL